jgi:hypothetical protein
MGFRNGQKRAIRKVVDGEKVCSKCLVEKPVDQFLVYKSGRQKGIVYSRCKECKNAASRAYDRDKKRDSVLRSVYGISAEEYDCMFKQQDGKCAICFEGVAPSPCGRGRTRTRLDIDHCHETGRVRGLLCRRCNTGLGHFLHDVKRLASAMEYMEN